MPNTNPAYNAQAMMHPLDPHSSAAHHPQVDEPNQSMGCYGSMITVLGSCLGFIGSIPGCCCFPNPYKPIHQGSVGLLTRFGKYLKTASPGLISINPLSDGLQIVDIRVQVNDIPRQFVMTKDNVGVNIDSVLYWQILDPYVATFVVTNLQKALVERTMTTLRQIFGSRTLQDSIEHRETIAHEIQEIVGSTAISWGVRIEAILIKDLMFTPELQESLSSAAKQKRIGESKIILAKAEVESAKLMREAADILNSPAAMQIRYLETMTDMAKSSNSKVIFMPSADNKMSIQSATVYEQMMK